MPGDPRRVEGRQVVIDRYEGYDDYMTVRSADNLRVHRDREASYDNHLASVVTVTGGKVSRWRDYLDPVAVYDASGWPEH